MNLRNRIAELEGHAHGPGCPTCGHDPAASMAFEKIVIPESAGPVDRRQPVKQPPTPPRCWRCGFQQMAARAITFDGTD